jgi:AcrR family transcriptional regulator
MPSSRPRRPPAPKLQIKAQPRQQRSQDTYEQILAITAQLLGEVGIERLSTNLVCQRLGLTPPALYHYFPNKYAIVHELGVRLMQVQDDVVAQWVTARTMTLAPAAFKKALAGMLAQMFEVTRQQPDGVWVLRALRAVPALQTLRLESHRRVTALIADAFLAAYPQADAARVRLTTRLAVEMGAAALDLLFDAPELELDAVSRALAEMLGREMLELRKLPGH